MRPEDYKELIYKTIGAAMIVHRELGGGLLEPIYNEALTMELTDRGIHADPEKYLPCYYRKRLMQKSYRMDIVVEDDVVLELKSVQKLIPAHRAQLFNYLRLTRKPIGLLINFGKDSLEGERYVYDEENNECYMVDKYMEPVEPVDEDDLSWYEDPYADVNEGAE